MASESLARRSSAADGEVVAGSMREPERFSEIFERYFAVIHGYLARRIGSDLADDLAAQVFTVAFERRTAFRPEAQSALPWLYGIATNLMRSHRRSERRLLAAVARVGNERAMTQEELGGTDSRCDEARLARALSKLDPDQRDVILLFAWAGLSHLEIANALEIPPGTVASRLFRARRRLRACLADRVDVEESVISKFKRSYSDA